MQLRQRQRKLTNIIIVFPDATTTLNVYLPLQLEAECITESLQVRYPTASNIILLPDTFFPVIGLLCKKNLQFSELNGIIILHLAAICDKSIFETRRQFPTEEIANFHCIDHIIRWYIMKVAMAPFNLNEKENQALSLEAFQVLDSLKLKRRQRLHQESYLGPMPFEDDLRRSCAEFYKELKKRWGFTPEKWFHMS